jgi:hypothetical protein
MAVPAAPVPTRTRRARRLLALCVGCVLALLCVELGVRWLLFSDSALAARWGAQLRQPESVADFGSEDYWSLQLVLGHPKLLSAPTPDAEIGWIGNVQPGTYALRDEPSIGGRRPVLLFGDSYAQCATRPEACFPALLEESELGREYVLLNYGVGGYGLDQILLLLRRVLPRFAERKPLVVISLMLDDDFTRSLLGLRCWPKSRAYLEQGTLRIDPPSTLDPLEYVRAHPVHALSWAWRLFVYRDGIVPRALQEPLRDHGSSIAERVAVNRALLETIAAELDAAGIEHCFLFFNGEMTLFDTPELRWTVQLARDFQRETQQPCVFTLPYLRAATCGEIERAHLLFGSSGIEYGHYNTWGNRIAFEALRQALVAPRGPPDLSRIEALCASGALADLTRTTRVVRVLGCSGELAAHSREPCIRFVASAPGTGKPELWLRASPDGGTALELEIPQHVQRFHARVERVVDGPSTCAEGGVRLAIELDGALQPAWPIELQAGSAPPPVELELAGIHRLKLKLELAGAREKCGWIVLRDLEFE